MLILWLSRLAVMMTVQELTGELVPSRRRSDALVWRSGLLSLEQILKVASSLITHGVIDKVKTRQLQRNEGKAAENV